MRRWLLTIAMGALLLMPAMAAHAQYTTDLSSFTNGVYGNSAPESNINNYIGLLIKALLEMLGVIFLILIIYAGMLWMTAGGNPDTVKKAKQLIFNGVIGLVIVTASYAIALTVVRYLRTNNLY